MEFGKNIFKLRRDLKYHKYRHGVYTPFTICDPKVRRIHKAAVRDRILHHALFRILNPIFEPYFISNSFSCRVDKGTHKGVETLSKMLNKASKNNTRTCFALKCDIKKFFDSVDHEILLDEIKKRIKDADAIWLVKEIIESFPARNLNRERERERERESKISAGNFTQLSIFTENNNITGIPIGNLTSQLFANVYMNKFDYYVKHTLRIKNYLRYTDDFVIVSENKSYLTELIPKIKDFLSNELKLQLHPSKIIIKKYRQGIDFLGYIVFPKHKLLRTKTKRRIHSKLRKRVVEYKTGAITKDTLEQSLNSYLGVLSHANTYKLKQDLLNQFWFWLKE